MKFLAFSAYVGIEAGSHISNVNLPFKKLEKEQMKMKANSKQKKSKMAHPLLKAPPCGMMCLGVED